MFTAISLPIVRYHDRLSGLMREFSMRFSDVLVLKEQLQVDEQKQLQVPDKWWRHIGKSMFRRFKTDSDNILDFIPTLDVDQIVNVPKNAFGAILPCHRQFTKQGGPSSKTLADAADASVIVQPRGEKSPKCEDFTRGKVSADVISKPNASTELNAAKTMEMSEVVVASHAREEKVGSQLNANSAPAQSAAAPTASTAAVDRHPAHKFVPAMSPGSSAVGRLEQSGVVFSSRAGRAAAAAAAAASLASISPAQASSFRTDKIAGTSSLAASGISILPRAAASIAQMPVLVPQTPPRSRSRSRFQGQELTRSLSGGSGDGEKPPAAAAAAAAEDVRREPKIASALQPHVQLTMPSAPLVIPSAPPRSRSRSRWGDRPELEPAPEDLNVSRAQPMNRM
jgi:hypothetical protein